MTAGQQPKHDFVVTQSMSFMTRVISKHIHHKVRAQGWGTGGWACARHRHAHPWAGRVGREARRTRDRAAQSRQSRASPLPPRSP